MSIKTRQKDIRAMIKYGVASPLSEAVRLVESGQRKYHDFEKVCYSVGVYGINGLAVRDRISDHIYADAARTTSVFYFG